MKLVHASAMLAGLTLLFAEACDADLLDETPDGSLQDGRAAPDVNASRLDAALGEETNGSDGSMDSKSDVSTRAQEGSTDAITSGDQSESDAEQVVQESGADVEDCAPPATLCDGTACLKGRCLTVL
jgi:hypothetical protein